MDLIKQLLQKDYIKYSLVLLVGITIGALFYPTKKIEEKISLKYEQEITSLKENDQKELEKQHLEYEKLKTEYKSYQSQSESKISSLTTQISNLNSKNKTKYVKIIRPDGTVEIRKDTESENSSETTTVTQIEQEYKQKIDTLNKQWEATLESKTSELEKQYSTKEQQYQKTIEDLKTSKITSINEKRFGIDFGILSDKTYFGDVSMDVWGPFYLNVQSNFDSSYSSNKLGAGIGFRF